MRKLIFAFLGILLFMGCTTIDKQYIEPKVRPKKYICSYHPFYMPYSIFGGLYFRIYSPYRYSYFYGSSCQLKYKQSKGISVITKKQLKARSSTTSRGIVVKKSQPKTVSRDRVKEGEAVKKKK